MPIENLPSVSDIGDLTPNDSAAINSASVGGDARVNFQLLAQYLFEVGGFKPPPEKQYANPSATGFSVEVEATIPGADIWVILTPAANYAAGSFALPGVDDAVDQQEILCTCRRAVTTFTVTADGCTMVNQPTTRSAGSFFAMRYDIATTTWYRVR